MSLPIIRLRTIDNNNATTASNPVLASCTIYTFLRSIPTKTECNDMMYEFKQHIQATRGEMCYFSKNNTEILNRISAAVQDKLLQHAPKISPELARKSKKWKYILKGEKEIEEKEKEKQIGNNKTIVTKSGNFSKHGVILNDDDNDNNSIQSPSSTNLLTSYNNNNNNNNRMSSVIVKENISTSEMHFKNPYEQMIPDNLSYIPNYIGSRTTLDITNKEEENNNTKNIVTQYSQITPQSSHEEDNILNNLNKGGYKPHPLLVNLLKRIQSTLSVEENEDDRREREFTTMMESRLTALRTKLSSAFASLSPNEKESIAFLQQLESRVSVAEKLFKVQKYEEETIQMTQLGLKLEIATMRGILRSVVNAVVEAEERHEVEGPRSLYYSEECHIMAVIQQALDDLPS